MASRAPAVCCTGAGASFYRDRHGTRAGYVPGDADRAREYTDQALAAAEDIADDEDRDLVLADLETIPGQPRYW